MLKFLRSSIYYQILLPLIGVVILIAVIFSFTGPGIITQSFEERTDLLLEQKLTSSQTYIENKLDEMVFGLESFSTDEIFQSEVNNKNYEHLKAHVVGELGQHESLAIINNNPNSEFVFTSGTEQPQEMYIQVSKLLDNSLLGKSVSSIESIDNKTYLCAATPMIVKNGKTKDYALVSVRKMDRDFLSAAAKVSNVELCLFNDKKLVQTSLNIDDASDKLIHQEMLRKVSSIMDEKINIDSVTSGGHFYKIIVKPITGKKNLFLAASIAADEILLARNKVKYQIWAGSILAVLIVSGIGLIVSNNLTGSMRELMSSADEISAGNYDKVIKTNEINEVGTLASSMNRMSQSLLKQRFELQQNISNLSALQELGKSLTATLDEKKIIEFTFESIMRLFEPDAGSIMLWNNKNKLLEIVKAKGLDIQTINNVKLRLGEGIAGYVAQNKKPLILNDSIGNGEFKPIQKKEKISTALCVPMLFKGILFGVINISNDVNHSHIYNQNDLRLLTTLASQASVGINNARVYDELQMLYLKTIKALGAAVDAKDPYTHGHSSRVAEYAYAIGEQYELKEEELLCVQTAGYLHDIGKIGIPDGILLKPGKLTQEEMEVIQTHPLISAKILEPVEFPWNVVDLVCHHHEFYNGKGYPDGIKGENISIGARILTVADSFEAMTSDRPYRKAYPVEYAIRELKKCSGSQFDPEITKIFIELAKAEFFEFL